MYLPGGPMIAYNNKSSLLTGVQTPTCRTPVHSGPQEHGVIETLPVSQQPPLLGSSHINLWHAYKYSKREREVPLYRRHIMNSMNSRAMNSLTIMQHMYKVNTSSHSCLHCYGGLRHREGLRFTCSFPTPLIHVRIILTLVGDKKVYGNPSLWITSSSTAQMGSQLPISKSFYFLLTGPA